MSNSMSPHVHHAPPSMGFLGNSTGVGCHFLLQGIFLTQGSNPGLPRCRQTLHRLSHQETYLVKSSFLILCWETDNTDLPPCPDRFVYNHIYCEYVLVADTKCSINWRENSAWRSLKNSGRENGSIRLALADGQL